MGHCLDSNTRNVGRQPCVTCYLEFRNMGIHKLSLLCFVCCLLWKCPQHLLTAQKGMTSAFESSWATEGKEGAQLRVTPNSVFKYRLRRFMYMIIYLFCRLCLPVTFIGWQCLVRKTVWWGWAAAQVTEGFWYAQNPGFNAQHHILQTQQCTPVIPALEVETVKSEVWGHSWLNSKVSWRPACATRDPVSKIIRKRKQKTG